MRISRSGDYIAQIRLIGGRVFEAAGCFRCGYL